MKAVITIILTGVISARTGIGFDHSWKEAIEDGVFFQADSFTIQSPDGLPKTGI